MDNQFHHKCILCSSDNLTDLKDFKNTYLCKCEDCSLVFAKKIPSPEELEEYYEKENYNRTTYFSPITVKRYEELLDEFEKFRNTGKLLDIGSGAGFFPEIALKRGWEVYGTELTDEAVEDCKRKGIKMFKGQLDDIKFDSEIFDVVTCIETIEHINKPKMLMGETYRILRHGGIAYMTTPNFNAVLRYWLKSKYDIIEYPLHLTYFTPKTIKKLSQDCNFEVRQISTYGISLTRYRTSKGKSNQDYVSETSDDEMIRYRIEKNGLLRLFKNTVNGVLNFLKVGDNIKVKLIKE